MVSVLSCTDAFPQIYILHLCNKPFLNTHNMLTVDVAYQAQSQVSDTKTSALRECGFQWGQGGRMGARVLGWGWSSLRRGDVA